MNWVSYNDQYHYNPNSDQYGKLPTEYITRGGDTIHVPINASRVDTAQEHSCGDVTFADVMVNSKRNVPRFFDKNHSGIYGTTQRGLRSRLVHHNCSGYFLMYSSTLNYFWPAFTTSSVGRDQSPRKIGRSDYEDEWYWDNYAYLDTMYFRPMKSKKLGPYCLACKLKSSCSITVLWQRLYDVILGIKTPTLYFNVWEIQEN